MMMNSITHQGRVGQSRIEQSRAEQRSIVRPIQSYSILINITTSEEVKRSKIFHNHIPSTTILSSEKKGNILIFLIIKLPDFCQSSGVENPSATI